MDAPAASLPLAIDAPHRVPRWPHAWAWGLLASQAVVAWVWWQFGWKVGLPLMVATHAPFWWSTLWPHSGLLAPVLNRLPTRERVVWLTIDDGPSTDTPALLDLLDAHDAKATFFLVGERAERHPELVREIARRGHGIGNHSHSHPAAWFWALGPSRMRAEVAHTQAVLTRITGAAPRWFRAVVGMSNPFVAAALRAHGLARAAWSVRGFDSRDQAPDAMAARIERGLHPGAIVLLHEGAAHGRNVAMVAALLGRLDALGYRAVLPQPR